MTSGGWVQATPDGVSLRVKVIPRAGVTRVAGTREGRLLVRLAAAPVDGAANEALIAFLSHTLNVPVRNIRLESGARNPRKQLSIAGLTPAQVARALSVPTE
jgi:uncharacterized protein